MTEWEEHLKRFLKDLAYGGFTTRSVETYRGDVCAFLAYVQAQKIERPTEITVEVLKAYQAHLFECTGSRGRRLTLATQAHHLAAVRRLFAYFYRKGLILTDPTRALTMPRVRRKLPAVILTVAEVLRFLKAIDIRHPLGVRDRAMFETLYSTGLRASELSALVPEDLDLVEGLVRVRRGKGQKSRVVPLGRIAAEWIRRYLDEVRPPHLSPGRPLFVSCRGQALTRGCLSELARRWGTKAQLKKKVTCHVFRHTCATHMLRGRASLRHIQELLGHADPNSTQIYTHVEILDLKRVHQRCHPRSQRR